MEWLTSLVHRKAAFVYPVLPAPRTAVLNPWFRPSGAIRIYERGWCAEASAYGPAAIAGTWPRLEPLFAAKLDSLTHAVIVLARQKDELLTVEQRKRLWQAFRVPVFEQVIGESGMLLAAECEAHAGLHVESPKLDTAGRAVDASKCGCGRATPRLTGADPSREIRAAAAYAR